MNRSAGKKPFVIYGIIVLTLLLIVLWSVNKVGGYVGSINIPHAYICKEIKQDTTPLPITEKLYPDQQQVCIWFEYERAKTGDKININCYKGKEEIIKESIIFTSKSGARAFYLVKSDGTPLPIGEYRVVLSTATKSWTTIPETFEVVKKTVPAIHRTSVKAVKSVNSKPGGANIAKNKKTNRRYQRRNAR